MSNPNNCAACDHMNCEHEGLHCYMFKDAPAEICYQHTMRLKAAFELLMIAATFDPAVPDAVDKEGERC